MFSIKRFCSLLLVTVSVSAMAQTSFVLGEARWGQATWGASTSGPAGAAPIPAMPIEGLAALVALMALLPFWKAFRPLLKRKRLTKQSLPIK
ncbi:hypothetical protein BST95_16380 [Halioglobus japonicus]|uniref:PEP-CTERM sorting domain-containing protein n=2 Tax=Halioglobus japonicus TaxID=930805 RepID=A0AAP8MGB6_9GAMM|nr:hypothetical protein BST95_16380 [Halioglobus japonicus]PLW87355.1 hypothetical protein C0029_01820 [Halioglobus japonicus]